MNQTLSQYGYKYGTLALDVAFNRRINGAVANEFARSVAASRGVKLTEQQWENLSIDLMKADWAARQGLGEGATADLSWEQYREYHRQVFIRYRLPIEAWTAETPLSGTGSYSLSASMWQSMLDAQTF